MRMRALRHPASVLLTIVALCAAHAQNTMNTVPLQQQIATIAAAHHGSVALYAENLRTHESVSLAPDQPVQTASTIKLAILYEALEQIREGRVHFDDKLVVTRADQVPGSGILLAMDTPLTLSFRDVLTYMIVLSDNTAANLAMDHVGIDNVNRRMQTIGLPGTHLYKKIFTPVAAGTVLSDDFKRFGLGKTTPREISALMSRFVRCDLGSPSRTSDAALCDAALHMLHLQFYREGIPRYLDNLPGADGTSIASKTGALEAARSDVAAISTPAGVIVLSVYTFANADQSWVPDQEAELTIAKLARAVVAAWSPLGLAPWPAPTSREQTLHSGMTPR